MPRILTILPIYPLATIDEVVPEKHVTLPEGTTFHGLSVYGNYVNVIANLDIERPLTDYRFQLVINAVPLFYDNALIIGSYTHQNKLMTIFHVISGEWGCLSEEYRRDISTTYQEKEYIEYLLVYYDMYYQFLDNYIKGFNADTQEEITVDEMKRLFQKDDGVG